MKPHNKILVTTVCGAVLLAFFSVMLYSSQAYLLAYREQHQLFLFDWNYILDLLSQPGGLAAIVGRFLVQFFHSTYAAAIITAVLLCMAVWAMWKVLDRLNGRWSKAPLALLPALLLVVSLLDGYFYYQGAVALTMALLALAWYSGMKQTSMKKRFLTGIIMTVLLYWLAGSVAFLFAVCAGFLEVYMFRKGALYCLLGYLAAFLVVAFISLQCGILGAFKFTWTPELYYEMMTDKMPFVHWASWIAVPVCMDIAFFVGTFPEKRKKAIQAVWACLLAVPVFLLFYFLVGAYQNMETVRFCELEYLTNNEDWDGIIRSFAGNTRNDRESHYVNMAYAEKGELCENLFRTNQNGPFALISNAKGEEDNQLVHLTHILFSMGNMAAAQSTAFNADQAMDVDPYMQKVILQVDLMRGAYDVAEKRICLLEKSLHYRKWATSMRRFLWNDEAVEADPVLGRGRRDFPKEDGFVLLTNAMDDLYKIVDANRADSKAMEYAVSYLLLAKDMDHVREFVDKYYGAPGFSVLPKPVQECLVFYSDYYQNMDEKFAIQNGMTREEIAVRKEVDDNYLLAHGISQEILARFAQFKKQFGMVRSGNADEVSLRTYRDTFWHYILFATINQPEEEK